MYDRLRNHIYAEIEYVIDEDFCLAMNSKQGKLMLKVGYMVKVRI